MRRRARATAHWGAHACCRSRCGDGLAVSARHEAPARIAPRDWVMAALAMTGGGAPAAGRTRFVVLAAAVTLCALALTPAHAEPQRRASEFWLDNGMQVVV